MHGRREGKKLRAWPNESKAGCGFKHIKAFNYELEKSGGVVNVKDKSFRVFFVLVSVF